MPPFAATLALFGLLSAVAAGATSRPEPSKPTHAIRGVVKFINSSSVVITVGSGKKAREMTFVLTSSTHVQDEPTIGAVVSIRYRLDHRTLVATAVSTDMSMSRAVQAGRLH
jgi:vacuolar-type H+-ATPase catalytic subunit A/Vma1